MGVTAAVKIATDTTGFIPFTVHVDASNCIFGGGDRAEECLFEWNFGDSLTAPAGYVDNNRYDSVGNTGNFNGIYDTPTTNTVISGNLKNKVRFHSPTIDVDVDNTGYLNRSADSNTKQQGFNAAFTYYKAGTYVPTLNVWRGGQIIGSATGATVTASAVAPMLTTGTLAGSQWVSITVYPGATGTTSDPSSRAFTDLARANAWINSVRGTTANTRVVLSNTGSNFTHSVSNTISVTANNIIFTTSDNNYLHSFTVTNSVDFSGGSPTPLLGIYGKNIYFENITFKSAQAGPTSCTASNINGVQIYNNANNITFHNCDFDGCAYGIYASSTGITGVYVNTLFSEKLSRYNSLYFKNCKNVVLSGLEIKNNSYKPVNDPSGALCSFSNITNAAVNWCYLDSGNHLYPNYNDPNQDGVLGINGTTADDYGYVYNNSSALLNNGAVEFMVGSNIHCNSNVFANGVINFNSVSSSRIDGNYITVAGGGQKSATAGTISSIYGAITLASGCTGIAIANNVFELKNNNMMGNVFTFQDSTAKGNIQILHNTSLVYSGVSNLIGIWDFTTNGATISNVVFEGNLHLKNGFNTLSNVIRYNNAGIFSSIGKNIYANRSNATNVRFANISGTNTPFSTWIATYPTDATYNVEIENYRASKVFILNSALNQNSSLSLTSSTAGAVNQYYTKTKRASTTTFACGASEVTASSSLYPLATSASGFNVSTSSILRNRPTNPNATVNDSQNLSLRIYDPANLVADGLTTTSAKRVIGNPLGDVTGTSYSNLLNGIGDNIKTTISAISVTNGIDIGIQYLNDGPAGQTASTSNSLGTIDIDSVLGGRFVSVCNDKNGFGWHMNPISLYGSGNYSGFNTASENRIYPSNKFSPVSIFHLRNYAVGISWISDYVNRDLFALESVYSAGSTATGPDSAFYNRLGKVQWAFQNNGIVNNKYLLDGQSAITITASIRVVRNPESWITTIQPLKDYYTAAGLSATTYAKDPRPVYMEDLVSLASGASGLYFNPTYGITSTGYSGYVSSAITKVRNNGFDRYVLIDPLGYNNGGTNPYPQFLSNIYRSISPYTAYPNMVSSISNLFRFGEEIPSFGFYQGFADTIPLTTPFYGPGTTYSNLNTSSSTILQKFYDEIDLASDYLSASVVVLDSFGSGVTNAAVSRTLSLLDIYASRYPNIKTISAKAKSDLYCFKSGSLVNNYECGNGPHHLANFLVPGNEIWCVDYGQYHIDATGSTSENQYRTKTIAAYGYVPTYFTPAFSVSGSTAYVSADRRYDYASGPSGYSSTPETQQSPWGLSAANDIATQWAGLIATMTAANAPFDYIVMDNEQIPSSYSINNSTLRKFLLDPRATAPYLNSGAILPSLADLGDGSNGFGSGSNPPRLAYDNYIGEITSALFNIGIYTPALAGYPNIKMSNYGGYVLSAANSVPDLNGIYGYNNNVYGNCNAPHLYGEINNSGGVYERSAWGAMLKDINQARGIVRSDSRPLQPWIGPAQYSIGQYASDQRMHKEMICHVAMQNANNFLYFNPITVFTAIGRGRTEQSTAGTLLNTIFADINTSLTGTYITPVSSAQIDPASRVIVSGLNKVSGGLKLRISAAPEVGQVLIGGTTVISVTGTSKGVWVDWNSSSLPSVAAYVPAGGGNAGNPGGGGAD